MASRDFKVNDKTYHVDSKGFLINPEDWDEHFAEAMASDVKIEGGLTREHWKVIRFIRNTFRKIDSCPLVYVACRKNHIGLGDLKRLFPTGYMRGACKLAGVTYRESYAQHYWLDHNFERFVYTYENKTYRVDVQGYLIDPGEWDELFAINKAFEMKMPEYLTETHWRIINYLRDNYQKTETVPTVYETCEENSLDLSELERLFPDGYHRGAVKIAGLHIR